MPSSHTVLGISDFKSFVFELNIMHSFDRDRGKQILRNIFDLKTGSIR